MNIKKIKLYYVLPIILGILFLIIPVTLCRFSETLSTTIVLDIRKPQYSIKFHPNKSNLPSEYTELEYIESTGNQHIITDIIPTNNTGVYAKLASTNVTADRVFFGSGTVTDEKRFWIGNTNGNIYYGWNGLFDRNVIDSLGIEVNTINEFEINYMNNRNLTYNGNICVSDLPELKEKTLPIIIFGYNNENTDEATSKSTIKLYEFKISENQTIIGDFIPCFRNTDNVVGVYDLIQNKFYENQGTEDFITSEIKEIFTYGTAQNLMPNTYEKQGSIFIGWNTKPDGSGTSYSDEQEILNLSSIDGSKIDLYAQWGITDYTVNFDANTGIGTMEEMYFSYNQSQKLLANAFTKEGYTFIGWNTKNDGTGTSYNDKESVVNMTADTNYITLYAQWEKNNYTINFYPNRNILPSEYTEIEYVEGTGEQHIITNIIPTNTTGIYAKLASTDVTSDNVFLGTGDSSSDHRFWFGNSKGTIYFGWNTLYAKTQLGVQTIKIDEVNTFQLNYMNNRKIIYNEKTCSTNLPELKEHTTRISIFGYNNTSDIVAKNVPMKLYELKVSENANVIANFIPCFKIVDGQKVVGLYDLVGNKFYEKNGTKDLVLGANTQLFEYDTANNLISNTYENEGYTFTGWNTKPDGSGTSYTDNQEVNNLSSVDGDDINLYAQWEKIATSE